MKNKIYGFLLFFIVVFFCSAAFAENLWAVQITRNLYQLNGQIVVEVLENGLADVRRATINNPDGGARISLIYINKKHTIIAKECWLVIMHITILVLLMIRIYCLTERLLQRCVM